jgi:hypothetical protein
MRNFENVVRYLSIQVANFNWWTVKGQWSILIGAAMTWH